MEHFEQLILDGKLTVDAEGYIVSEKRNGTLRRIGNKGNSRGNIVLNYRGEGGQPMSKQAQRVAWRIHHGYWPPSDMSVMMINGNKSDFRRLNLALVPRGQENRAKLAIRGPNRAS